MKEMGGRCRRKQIERWEGYKGMEQTRGSIQNRRKGPREQGRQNEKGEPREGREGRRKPREGTSGVDGRKREPEHEGLTPYIYAGVLRTTSASWFTI